MQELLKNAWLGWQNYTDEGKLAALMAGALLFLWLKAGQSWRDGQGARKAFLLYGSVSALCCAVPVTAAALMLYQTRFYDYEWIWALVPVTAVIAWGAGELLKDGELCRLLFSFGGKKGLAAGLTAVLLTGTAFLCGSLGGTPDKLQELSALKETERLLQSVTEGGQRKDVVLLAPKEIMENARALDGSIRLPYGRNMWENALNGYSYDVYAPEIKALYGWMCSLEQGGEADMSLLQETEQEPGLIFSAAEAVEEMGTRGINCFVAPAETPAEVLGELEELLGTAPESLEGGYLFRLQQETGQ